MVFRSKAVLCVLLVVNLHVWLGACTGPSEPTAPLNNVIRIELTPDHSLAKALGTGVLDGAKAFEIDPVLKTFRVIFADPAREVTGKYASVDGAIRITKFTFGRLGRSVTMELDLSKRVRTIDTDDGFHWQRPSNWKLIKSSAPGVQGYVDVNAQLLAFARDVDQPDNPPSSGGNVTTVPGSDQVVDLGFSGFGSGKNNRADPVGLLLILETVLAIWGPIISTLGVLLSIFLVISLIQAMVGNLDQTAAGTIPTVGDEPPPVDGVPPVDGGTQPPVDCNDNGVSDQTDLTGGTSPDCNANEVPDECDIAAGTEQDTNGNGVPDVCENLGRPDDTIIVSVTASRDWTYEHLVFKGTAVNNCEVSFVANIDNDPLGNSSYTYQWTITPPADRPGAAFTPVSGETTATPAFLPPARPASSANDYVVTVTATGNDSGNTGTATTTIKVRLLGDTDNSGCVDQADIDFVNMVEADNVTDPDMVLRADVNCDETTNYVQDATLVDFVRLNRDGDGNGCDLQACCMPDGSCSDLIPLDCSAAGGLAQGMGTTCATTTCPNAIAVSVTASRDWTYEHLVFDGTAVNNCEVSFIADIVDPLGNTTYTYQWTITPPADRPGAAFTPVSGETTATPTFLPPARPASSADDYIVTVMVTGDQQGNVGVGTTRIKVRLLGDTDNSGCVDQADIDFVNMVEADNVTDPDMVLRADVNCDQTTNYVLDANLVDFVRLDIDGQGNGSCN